MSAHRVVCNLDKNRSPGVRMFGGRDRGEQVRRYWRLDEADANGACVHIVVPMDTFSCGGGFILNLLGPSFDALGEAEFRRRYTVEGPECAHEALAYVIDVHGHPIQPLFP